jgi:hypothetical protein
MAAAERVLDTPSKMAYYLWFMARAEQPGAIVEAVREYLASWSRERILAIQKIDAGWAPFDDYQYPQQIHGALDLRCIRDAIHAHCIALREAGVALTPELVELDEFFFTATGMIESFGQPALRAHTAVAAATEIRTPPVPSHTDVIANW